MQTRRGSFARNQLPGIAWAVAIFVGSCIPGESVPELGFKVQDKIAHMIEFGILAYLLLRAFGRASHRTFRERPVLWAGACGTAWGIVDEVHQLFVPGRCGTPYDAMADAVGVLGALAVSLWLQRRRISLHGHAQEDEC
jgi:VanZ family protein